MGGGARVGGAFPVYCRGTRRTDVDDRAVAVAGPDEVITRIIAGAVLDDQAASAVYLDTAIIAGDVIPFDSIVAAGGMDAGTVAIERTVIFPDNAGIGSSDSVAAVELRIAV